MNIAEVGEAALRDGGVAVALVSRASSENFRLANNTVTTNGREESTSCGVIAIEGDSVEVLTTDVQDRDQVARLARNARAGARSNPPAPDAMPLLTPEEAALPSTAGTGAGADEMQSVIDDLHSALEDARRSGLRLYGYVQETWSQDHLATQTGVALEGERAAGSVSLTLKTPDLKRSSWCGRMATGLSGIDIDSMYSTLRDRLAWTEHRVELPPGRYQVILEPSAVADMVIRLAWEMHARGADEERTVFSREGGTRVGERMYAPTVSLESDPAAPHMRVPDFVRTLRSSEYSSVFDNGLAAGPMSWIESGVQQDLVCPRRWARDHGHPVRPDPENLRMAGTDTSLEQMIRDTDRALLVTSLWYIRDVDPTSLLLTGLTRDGVFLVERGQVVGAVNNFRFNESPVNVLASVTQMGRPELAFSREIGDSAFVEVPPLRVDGFHMSSVSDAV